MSVPKLIFVPLAFAELLHATLGPLSDVLDKQGHDWAPMVRRVLAEYTSRRDQMLTNMHGEHILDNICDATQAAALEVEQLVSDEIEETILGLVGGLE